MTHIIPIILSIVFFIVLVIVVRMILLVKNGDTGKVGSPSADPNPVGEASGPRKISIAIGDADKKIESGMEKTVLEEPEPADRMPNRGVNEATNLSDGGFFVKASYDFQKKMEEVLAEEIQSAVSDFRGEVRNASLEILGDYRAKIEGIDRELKESYSDIFKEMSQRSDMLGDRLNETIEEELERYREESSKVGDFLMEETKRRSEALLAEVDKRFIQVCGPVEEAVKANMNKMEKEIERYKEEKLKETDEKIYQVIKSVTHQVVGKMIDPSTHEKLVTDALERSKRENFFGTETDNRTD